MTTLETAPVDVAGDLDARLRGVLPKAYGEPVRFDGEGAQKRCYRAPWGVHGRRRFLKAEITNGGITRDVDALTRMDEGEALEHHVSPIVDYGMDGDFVWTAEPEFEGARTLREVIEQGGPIKNQREFEDIFGQVIEALRYLGNDKKILHRDLHGGNILVRERGRKREVRITDLRNAAASADLEPSPEPTQCSRFIRDPWIDRRFAGEDGAYSQKSEAYAIGMNAIVALTGQAPVSYDYRTGKAINAFTGESLFDEDGKWSREKHNKAVAAGIKKIPWRIRRRHGEWIENCLTATPVNRWSSLESLARNFESAAAPGTLEWISKNFSETLGITALTGIIASGLTIGGIIYASGSTKMVDDALKTKVEPYKVATVWDGADIEIKNNLIDLEINATRLTQKYPENCKFISVNPGDHFSVYVYPYEIPRQKGQFENNCVLNGQMYIEGVPTDGKVADEFTVTARYPNKATDYGRGSGYYGVSRSVHVPEDLPSGSYTLAVELFAPREGEERDKSLENIEFDQPGKAINRKRINIVVGDPAAKVDLGEAKMSYQGDHFVMRNLERDPNMFYSGDTPAPKGQFYFMTSPADDYSVVEDFGGYMRLERAEDASGKERRDVYFATYDDQGRRISYTALPLHRIVKQGAGRVPTSFCNWELDFPDKNFARRLSEEAQKIDGQFKEARLKGDHK